MKRICFTYHMHINHGTACNPVMEVAESCVTLAMTDEIADDILLNMDDSPYIAAYGAHNSVRRTLERVAEIQGYNFTGVVAAKEVTLQGVN